MLHRNQFSDTMMSAKLLIRKKRIPHRKNIALVLVAYRQWVCSMVLPMWLDGNRVKPCRTFCHEVERLCPYFLPAEKSGPGSQYAGEPSFLCIDPDVRETTNQSTNSAYSERPCYRPCTLEYNLEPDIDPSLCVASLGDISGLMEEDGTVEADKECQQTYTNVTASISEFDVDMLDVDSEVNNDQCTPLLGKDPLSTSRLSSRGWTNNLHFVWPWRTIVLPFAMLPIIHFFTAKKLIRLIFKNGDDLARRKFDDHNEINGGGVRENDENLGNF
ncbi:hypothetical protein OUZ56_027270 [Daphnia magna]|uniref:FZ domain-containing protein n=1 Tax=Daphnia magna TaxID=35525 RepID=A0ABQ9ZPB2_9CRUS|nr:hypothetical protein OUZ56_027270 [Daphnia magna]